MKKLSLLFAGLLCMARVMAQDAPPPGPQNGSGDDRIIRFGVYFAPNLSWMHTSASKTDDGSFGTQGNGSKMGYTWGLMGEYYFADNYALVTGFQLDNTGGKILATNTVTTSAANMVKTADFNYSFTYFEIPGALKLRTDDLGGFKLFGQLGLTLGVNIGKKASYTVDYYDVNGNAAIKTGDKEKLVGSLTIAPIMMQLNIGGGVEYPITQKLNLYGGLFFNNGFLPDATNPSRYNLGYDGKFADGHVRLNNLALRVGIFF